MHTVLVAAMQNIDSSFTLARDEGKYLRFDYGIRAAQTAEIMSRDPSKVFDKIEQFKGDEIRALELSGYDFDGYDEEGFACFIVH